MPHPIFIIPLELRLRTNDVIGLLDDGTGPKVERGILIRVAAFDWNSSQHIPVRLTNAERGGEIALLKGRISPLKAG